jgi:hypothetical protein
MSRGEITDVPHEFVVYPNVNATWDGPEFNSDIRIAGIDFLSAASEQYPYQRQLTKVTKQQLDTSDEPGDNSLEGWWTQSQTDWSGGADQVYFEPASDDLVQRKFWESAGVDVFNDPGFFNLLPNSKRIAGGIGDVANIERVGDGGYVLSFGTEIEYVDANGGTYWADVNNEIIHLAVVGSHVLISQINNTTEVYRIIDLTTKVATIHGYTGVPKPSFVKNRLMFAVGNKMWEIPDWTVDTDLSTIDPVIEMPSVSAIIGNAISTPSAIITYANDTHQSVFLSLKLDDTGTLPDLAVPIEVGMLPSTERVRGISAALGTYIIVLTSLGARVGNATDDGGLVYGPLIGSPAPSGQESVGSVVASIVPVHAEVYDRFVSYPVDDAGDGLPGDVVIDLSVSDDEGRYAWSNFTRFEPDMTGHHVDSIRIGARETVHSYANGTRTSFFRVHDDYGLMPGGWLSSSWVRYGTLETKYFDAVKVVCDPTGAGSVRVTVSDDEENEFVVGTLTEAMGQEATFKINSRRGMTDMAVKVELFPTEADDSVGPLFAAWSLRAWPSVESRGEQIVVPLLCFDHEVDSLGVNVGYEGYAKDRWNALVDELTSGVSVLVTEINSGFTYTAIAEDATFTQTAPGNNASGFGGIVQVVLRKT